ncbi:MAG: DUF5606 domain-containing protein [Bacteroidota bacterium]|jgi:hypothetical protein|nr:DUF5606 domain-containing protein [Bacteroidales bacterium]MDI9534730.1 DUF5606 domain-containing protein [Bacteroidota bacterium]OQC44694.1 MAG: hypothetical protein BWX59_01745 [Bacteroidetes bacterium ADurb.Bin028]NLP19211.1 DUF5606 domain-containing protein [Bacteroidales bacterium]HNY43882.1 DUF5606 domain-containing protein [Bacteroidales bacterium]
MFLEGILSISGQAGLFKLISKGNNNVIVESLNTGKRMPTFTSSRISTLSDVAIYTDDNEDISLREVLIKMFEKFNGETIKIGKDSNKELAQMLESVLPNYDKSRVYISDIKKLTNWYNSLIEHKILTKENIKIESEEAKKSAEKENNATE